mmetsp:Transcript_28864/g.61261  ORF Transcript_28864/g.61261 Transcript_28864/m.61261 type:complete len:102 (+) Transcript_28864:758-1063(+)
MAPRTGPPMENPTTPPRRPAVNSTVSSLMGTIAVVFSTAGGASAGGAGASSDMDRRDAERPNGAGAKAEAEPTRRAETRSFPYFTMVARGEETTNEADLKR